jgi:hypothetical protein
VSRQSEPVQKYCLASSPIPVQSLVDAIRASAASAAELYRTVELPRGNVGYDHDESVGRYTN